ncbi:Thioredoxin, conserved site [Sergentomyia squamirostris]
MVSRMFLRTLSNFGRRFDWADNLTAGLKRAEKEVKPLMIVIHATGCPACKSLKTEFASDKTLLELSKKFVMVSAMDEEEPQGKEFKPDGMYYPRILFISPCGNVLSQIVNEHRANSDSKYFYSKTLDIKKSMNQVIKIIDK